MRCCIGVILLLCFLQTQAQVPAIQPTIYQRSQGLPENNVTSITQDSRGFIWIGSHEGLFRFDGLHFKSWYANPNDSNRFKGNFTEVIEEYKPGYILFISNSRLWRIHIAHQKIEPITRHRSQKVVSIVRANKTQWCMTTADSVLLLNHELDVEFGLPLRSFHPTISQVASFPLQYPFVLLYASNPSVWRLFNYNTKTIHPLDFDNSNLDGRARFYMPQLYDSARRRLYLSAYFNGLYYCDLDISKQDHYIPAPFKQKTLGNIRKTLLTPEQQFLQAGEHGLYLIDNTEKQHLLYPGVMINLFRANDGDYWASSTEGIIRFNLNQPVVQSWPLPAAGDKDEIQAIIKGNDGMLYCLLREKSLWQLDRVANRFHRVDSAVLYAWRAIKNNEHIIVTGGGKKIIDYNTLTKKISFPTFLETFYTSNTDLVTLAFKSSNGDTWFSCNGGGGLIRNPAGTNQYIQYSRSQNPPSFNHSYLICAAEDKNGNIWFGSNKSSSLLKWDPAVQNFKQHPVYNLLPNLEINTGVNNLHFDTANNLWIALDANGLLKYNVGSRKGEYYDINRGLPTDAISGICHDAKNRVWLGTKKGLSCYLPGKDKILTFTHYDGFPSDKFEDNTLFFDAEENRIYAGSGTTLASFNPDSLLDKTITRQPSVYIGEMQVNGKALFYTDEKNIWLKTKENNISFSFASPDLNRNNQLVFQYQLKGNSIEWIDLDEERSVTFNNLRHGKYTLSVRCRYKGTEDWKETDYPFTFTIQTPLLKTTWFRLLLFVATGLLIFLLIRNYYRRKLERQRMIMEKDLAVEQERTRMARELHDGLGSMLSGLKHSFTALQREVPMQQQQGQKFNYNIEKLNDTIRELRDISNSMDAASMLKHGLENSLRDYCHFISQSAGMQVTFSALQTETRAVTEEQSFHIFRIIQELIQNVVKHATASHAIVQTSINNGRFYLTVEDDGKGFDYSSALQNTGMGLKNIAARVKILKGKLDYSTAPGKGTSVMIEFPIQ